MSVYKLRIVAHGRPEILLRLATISFHPGHIALLQQYLARVIDTLRFRKVCTLRFHIWRADARPDFI